MEADFPSRLLRRARLIVWFLGMGTPQEAFAHDPAGARIIAVDRRKVRFGRKPSATSIQSEGGLTFSSGNNR